MNKDIHNRNLAFSVRETIVDYGSAFAIVVATVIAAILLEGWLPRSVISLLFLTGVLLVSAWTGLGPSLFASILSFLALNFFFTQPYYTLEVADKSDMITLLFFLIIAFITGNLAARMRREVAERRVSLQRISKLYEFSRQITSATRTEEVYTALANHLAQSFDKPVAIFTPADNASFRLQTKAGPSESLPDTIIEDAWLREYQGPFRIETWDFFKLITNGTPSGMVAISMGHLDSEQINLVKNFCDQSAVVLDRIRLVADLEKARLATETEQLRSALLSSVSHDLRTPLASIIGSTTSLLEYGKSFSEVDHNELLETILTESQRLDRYIQNLLDMTRIGRGKLNLARDWVDLHDIVSGAVDRLRSTLKDLTIDIDIQSNMPLLWVHGILIEQCMVNLLDNAIRFSPKEGTIGITARHIENRIEIDICDDGPGIPIEEREKIFDMFYTVRQGDRATLHGTGLGLAICRALVGAHGGTVTAHDGRTGRGTCMRVTLPVIRPSS